MKIALLSDIHANRQALDACLAHARAQGARQFALLGDLVGYGGDPAAVVDQAMATALGVATQSLSNAIRVLEPRGYLDVQRVGKGTKAPRRIRITAAGRAFLATVGA